MVNSVQENSGSGGERVLDVRALREAHGLTLTDVYQATKISVLNLEAIEKGEFQQLPPPIYTKAYLRAYAKLLGADAQQMIGRYEDYLAVVPREDEEEPDQCSEKGSIFPPKVVIAVSIAAVLFLAGLIIYVFFHFQASDAPTVASSSRKAQAMPAEAVKDTSVTTGPEISPQITPTPTYPVQVPAVSGDIIKGKAAEGQKNSPAPVDSSTRLLIRAQEKTWLRIGEGDKQPYQILMNPGEQIERFAPQFSIDVGNAAGITIEFQGKVMEHLGQSGEVVHVRLP